jgi:hypothetical protein
MPGMEDVAGDAAGVAGVVGLVADALDGVGRMPGMLRMSWAHAPTAAAATLKQIADENRNRVLEFIALTHGRQIDERLAEGVGEGTTTSAP